MNAHRRTALGRGLGLALAATLAWAAGAAAHCDTLDGPVVAAARRALDTGDVNHALIWVQPAEEGAVRDAFRRTRAVRDGGDAARELADGYFFETVVRLHRAGEGAPYTGLKPAGTDLGPAIPCADRALESGDLAEMRTLLTDAVTDGLRERFDRARAARGFAVDDVAAGRRYVEAYVRYVHYVEEVYGAARGEPGEHGEGGMHP